MASERGREGGRLSGVCCYEMRAVDRTLDRHWIGRGGQSSARMRFRETSAPAITVAGRDLTGLGPAPSASGMDRAT
jgi:hypothetical protein